MGYKTGLLRNQIIIILLTAGILTGCGWLIGLSNLLKSILFILVAAVCLIGGTLFIIGHLGHKEHLSFIILAVWYSFSFALFTLLGMLLDPRSTSFTWVYFLKVAGIVGVGTFLFIILSMPIYKAALRFWRQNFGIPMSRPK